MAEHPLKQYIKGAKEAGLNTRQIADVLTHSGWHIHHLIDVILDTHKVPEVPNSIISVKNISKSYGKVKALDNISLDIVRGQVTALLGPNGAGKTTLVHILTTLLSATSGTATVNGLDVSKDAEELRSIIGLAGQYAAVDEILTGRENLEMVGRLYHLTKDSAKKRAVELLHEFDLDDASDRPVKTYSGGMRRRLDLAASLIKNPSVLFLDEPTTGLDPRSRFVLWNVIRDLVEKGTTVLLTTQYMEEADQLASKIFVIDHGHIIAKGTPDELKNQIGSDILEIHMKDHAESTKAVEIIGSIGNEQPSHNIETGIVTVPVEGGADILIQVIRKLDTAGLKISDIRLRRPTLDDVFMKLTGHHTE
jgi:ABC-2 type transport system ATP-binding protein